MTKNMTNEYLWLNYLTNKCLCMHAANEFLELRFKKNINSKNVGLVLMYACKLYKVSNVVLDTVCKNIEL